jgi:hypothetical protein
MVRDDLLEQIRQPLLDRVDRRLAAILGISIAAHLAIAIAAWLTKPPERSLFDVHPAPVVSIVDADELPGMVTPGTTAPAPASPAPPAVAPTTTKPRGSAKRPTPPDRAVDVRTLVSDALGDSADLTEISKRAPGRDLGDQLDDAKARGANARVGKNGVDPDSAMRTGDGAAPDVDTGGVTKQNKKNDNPGTVTFVPTKRPPPGTDFDPSSSIRNRFMIGIRRCYERHLLAAPGTAGRVDLDVVVGTRGAVDAATARSNNLPDVATCVEDLAARWRFDVVLDEAAEFSIKLVFVPGAP